MTKTPLFRLALILLPALVALMLAWSLTGPAQAQHLCSGSGAGPGPGERQVGVTQSGNGTAGAALCVYEEDSYDSVSSYSTSYAPAPPWNNSYLAHAGHPDASDVWIAAGHSDQASAEAAALAACNRAMGGECKNGGWVSNGAVAVAMDSEGNLWADPGDDQSEARAEAERRCREHSKLPCTIIRSADSPAWQGYVDEGPVMFAPEGDYKRHYASSAWTENDPEGGQWKATVWFSGGHASREQAEATVSEACRRDSGLSCKVVHTTADTFLYVAVNPTGLIYVGSAADDDLVSVTVQDRCRADNTTCEVKGWFGAASNETVTLDTRTARTLQ